MILLLGLVLILFTSAAYGAPKIRSRTSVPTAQPTVYVPDEDTLVLCSFYSGLQNKSALGSWECANRNWGMGACDDLWVGVGCNDSRIVFLRLNGLHLSGTISAALGDLEALQQLDLSSNSLSGSIPSSLGDLTALQALDLSFNYMSGSIPSTLGGLTELVYIYLSNNGLTGTLNMSLLPQSLQTLDFSNNSGIVGDISSLGGLPNLEYLNLASCGLTGTLPPLLSLSQLSLLDVSYNAFVGPLPSSLWSLQGLSELYLAGNGFSGSLSAAISNLTSLKTFSVDNNKLASSLPSELGDLTSIQTLDLRRNKFEQQIPVSLKQLDQLRTLLLGGNQKLTSFGLDFLDPRRQGLLECIDVSSNNLSGVIDGGVFHDFKALKVLSAGSNCFQMSSLPSEICLVSSLHTLVLDGMTSGEACKENFWIEVLRQPFNLTGTYSKYMIDSTLPPCLLRDMPNLATLHLSGLGLRGSIPNVKFSPSLRDLTLSTNRLTGHLPFYLQNNLSQFSSVDLSNNRINGEFLGQVCRPGCSYKREDFGNECTPDTPLSQNSSYSPPSCFVSLNLAVNRFSGLLPSNIDNAANISLLEGNVFTCSFLTSRPLPQQDPFYENFSCGSNFFETVFATWFVVLALGAFLFVRKEVQERQKEKERIMGHYSTQQYLTWQEFYDILAKAVEAECHPQLTEIKFWGRKVPVHKLLVIIAASVMRMQAPVQNILRPSLLSLDNRESYSFDSRVISLRGDSLHLSTHTNEDGRPSSTRDSIPTRISTTEAEPEAAHELSVEQEKPKRILRCSMRISRLLESMNELHALVVVSMLLFLGLLIVYGCTAASTGMLNDAYAWATTTAFRSGFGCAVAYLLMWSACLLGVMSLVLLQRRNRGLTFGPPKRKSKFLSELKFCDLFSSRGEISDEIRSAEATALDLLIAQRKLDPDYMLEPTSAGARFNELVDDSDDLREGLKEKLLNGWDRAFGGLWSKNCIGIILVLRTVFVTAVNITAVLAVNSAYVSAVVKANLSVQYGVKALLVVFLLVWNKVIIPSMLHSKNSYFGVFFRFGMTFDRVDAFTQRWLGGSSFDVVLLTINSIVAPTVAAMSTSNSCFRGALRQERTVHTSYFFQYTSLDIPVSTTSEFAYTPSFVYSYTCSSLLVTLYSPIYIGVALWTTCAVPIIGHLVARIESENKEPTTDGKATIRGRKLGIRRYYVQSTSDLIILFTLGLVCPLVGLAVGTGIVARTLILQYRIVTCMIGQLDEQGVRMVPLYPGEESVVRVLISTKLFFQSLGAICSTAFKKRIYALTVWLSDKGIVSSIKKRTKLTRLSKHRITGRITTAFDDLENEAKHALRSTATEGHSPVFRTRFVLYFFLPLFLSLFLFDIAGDVQGHKMGAWAPVLMTLIPWLLFCASEFYDRYGAVCSSADSTGPPADPEADVKVYTNPLHGATMDSAMLARARTRTHLDEFRPEDGTSRLALSPHHHNHSPSTCSLPVLAEVKEFGKEVELHSLK